MAIEGVQTKGTAASDAEHGAGSLMRLFLRRDSAAVLLAAALWLVGLYLRPDFWGSLDNSFGHGGQVIAGPSNASNAAL